MRKTGQLPVKAYGQRLTEIKAFIAAKNFDQAYNTADRLNKRIADMRTAQHYRKSDALRDRYYRPLAVGQTH